MTTETKSAAQDIYDCGAAAQDFFERAHDLARDIAREQYTDDPDDPHWWDDEDGGEEEEPEYFQHFDPS